MKLKKKKSKNSILSVSQKKSFGECTKYPYINYRNGSGLVKN